MRRESPSSTPSPLWHGPNSVHERISGVPVDAERNSCSPGLLRFQRRHEQSNKGTLRVELNCEAVSPYPLLCRCCDSGRCLPLP